MQSSALMVITVEKRNFEVASLFWPVFNATFGWFHRWNQNVFDSLSWLEAASLGRKKANFSERSDINFRKVQYSSKSKHSKRQCSISAVNTARSGSCRANISCSRHFYVVNLVNVKNVLCFTVWTGLEKDFVDKISLREWYKYTSWNQQSEAYRVGNERDRWQEVKAEKWLKKVVQKNWCARESKFASSAKHARYI